MITAIGDVHARPPEKFQVLDTFLGNFGIKDDPAFQGRKLGKHKFFFCAKNIVELSVGRGVYPPKKDDRGEVEYSEDIQYSRTWIISVIQHVSSH
jgi:hypothetical protein